MSLFKKILGKEDSAQIYNNTTNTTHNAYSARDIQPIGMFLQQKFSRGINYNLKIVIRGDRGVGKTSLLTRLKGEAFSAEYSPSNEIQVANIHWNHRNSQTVIKVEVWDVIDKGKPRGDWKNLKIFNEQAKTQLNIEPCLDASFVDVYKGAHGVILVLNMTKSWTFDYVCRELERIPPHIPVLIMSNFYDMNTTRVVTEQRVRHYLETTYQNRYVGDLNQISPEQMNKIGGDCCWTNSSVPIHYCEASMLSGFGLIYLHRFFNLPFLCLQSTILREQLKTNQQEVFEILHELNPIDSDESIQHLYQRLKQPNNTCTQFRTPHTLTSTSTIAAQSPQNCVNVKKENNNENGNATHGKTDVLTTGQRVGQLNQVDNTSKQSDGHNSMVTSIQEQIDPEDLEPCNYIYHRPSIYTTTTTDENRKDNMKSLESCSSESTESLSVQNQHYLHKNTSKNNNNNNTNSCDISITNISMVDDLSLDGINHLREDDNEFTVEPDEDDYLQVDEEQIGVITQKGKQQYKSGQIPDPMITPADNDALEKFLDTM